ncbi:hypothetical protein TOPH_03847 [Tolypocladium ophioglossoides CBS 100239]|uniref:Cytidyltransferase-like domain-containing protein n=1 Tax=Tolypocladium ophioglossoides (strain CBS 100239) TaxID=1163406 RepID=A0A0L0NC14_TOLOC|nr:hypothetical protein TOPH_03847 [Tolypocladium ophioglossoides CBS 100239]
MASRRVGDLVEKAAAQQGLRNDPSQRPFNNGNAQDPPLLRPNRAPNHVLLYPGCFNPPHKGHLALLNQVLRNAGADLSLAAAVIVLTDDDKLAAKNRKEERPLLLSKARRAALWREAGITGDRVWVFGGSEDSWKGLRGQLQRNLARQKIDLRFLLLVGPDWISVRSATDPKSWGCVEAVTSDISRPAAFRCPNSLRQLPKCSLWAPCSYQSSGQPSMAVAETPCETPADGSNSAPGLVYASTAVVSTCQTLRKPLRRYRFVPCELGDRPQGEAPSSTEIRRIIATCGREQLEGELAKVALSPSLLAMYALEGGPYTAPAPRASPPDHETRKLRAAADVKW